MRDATWKPNPGSILETMLWNYIPMNVHIRCFTKKKSESHVPICDFKQSRATMQ